MKRFLFTEIPCLEGESVILKKIVDEDAEGLEDLRKSGDVYRLLPTFLFEQQIEDVHEVIRQMYEGPLYKEEQSLMLGIYPKGTKEFAGIIELYGYRKEYQKISLGYRLRKKYWGQGLATDATKTLLRYLSEETHVEIVTASTLPDNAASANVLTKCGFTLVVDGVGEDWGYPTLLPTDKWIA